MADRNTLEDIALSLRRIADALSPNTSGSAYLLGLPLREYPKDVQLAFINGDLDPAFAFMQKRLEGQLDA